MDLIKNFKCFVTKRFLLLEAAMVWMFAGGMLLFRGSAMLTTESGFSWLKIISCFGFGLLFFLFVFSNISRRHINRITNLPGDCQWFSKFFSLKSYLMMFVMISLGIFLRQTSVVPLASLSLAYITMGIPLLFSSFRFYHSWFYYVPVIDRPIN